MILYGLDVTGAFLNADFGEAVYLELPDRLRPRTADGDEQVWRLKKTPYGLNRAQKVFSTWRLTSLPMVQALPSRPIPVPQDHRGPQDHPLRPRR